MANVNFLAVLIAALSAFALGGLWYGPLFKPTWCREAGVDPDQSGRHPALVFGIAFLASFIAAWFLAVFLGKDPSLSTALHAGIATGFGFVAMSFAINYAFAGRSLKLWLIDGGYHVLQFTLYGLILALWRWG